MAETIFPDILLPEETAGTSEVLSYGKELAFDFENNDFIYENGSPKVVEGIHALKVWIEKALRTVRFRWPVYTENFGSELEDIIGADIPRPVLESEAKRAITEALIYDDRIAAVQDFIFERGDDWLKITFTVITVLGDTVVQEVSAVV